MDCHIAVTFYNLKPHYHNTVEPVLKDHPTGHKNMVIWCLWRQVQLSWNAGPSAKKGGCLRWSPIAVVFQDRFHCILNQDYNGLCISRPYIQPENFTLTLKLALKCMNIYTGKI